MKKSGKTEKVERVVKSDRRGLRSDDALLLGDDAPFLGGDGNLPLRVVTKRNEKGEALDSFRVVQASVEMEYDCPAFSPVPFVVAPGVDPCKVCGEGVWCVGALNKRGAVLTLDIDYGGGKPPKDA